MENDGNICTFTFIIYPHLLLSCLYPNKHWITVFCFLDLCNANWLLLKHESHVISMQPLCESDPMLAMEFSMPVLESCPTQTIELFLSANIPADLVNSYLKQHAPKLQATYLEQMLAINESGISANLQNEMVKVYVLIIIILSV